MKAPLGLKGLAGLLSSLKLMVWLLVYSMYHGHLVRQVFETRDINGRVPMQP
jgi:hypothetical protein